MKLRQVNVLEFEIVFDILEENAKWLSQKGIHQWHADWLVSQRLEIKESINIGAYHALDIDGNIAAIVEIKSGLEKIWSNDETPALYIHKLAIRRKYAVLKLGNKILNLVEASAISQGIKLLRLDCVAENSKLRRYYESSTSYILKLRI